MNGLDFFRRSGGLESISEPIAAIPARTGMAYVFVQHLDPVHGSHLVFAEEENSASFFRMPRSAIQTGCVDSILAPRYIPQELVGISRHHCLRKGKDKLMGSGPDR